MHMKLQIHSLIARLAAPLVALGLALSPLAAQASVTPALIIYGPLADGEMS
jgi:hypothetical protein